MIKTPQDHLSKTVDFEFRIGTETYTLPPAVDYAGDVPGELTLDMMADPSDVNSARVAIATLKLAASPEAYKALSSLPTKEMIPIITDWFQAKTNGVGAGE